MHIRVFAFIVGRLIQLKVNLKATIKRVGAGFLQPFLLPTSGFRTRFDSIVLLSVCGYVIYIFILKNLCGAKK